VSPHSAITSKGKHSPYIKRIATAVFLLNIAVAAYGMSVMSFVSIAGRVR
jgi:hypothetical protein